MSTKLKAAKNNIESSKTKFKNVLSGLEKLKISSNPDKEQLRYLSHKLLNLINGEDGSPKVAATKSSIELILCTLESCSDHTAILSLIETLGEISKEGNLAMKKLISHDTTRTLLYVFSNRGHEFNHRLLFSIICLLSKLAPKDKKFGLRARLTGALGPLLSTIRLFYNHNRQAKMLSPTLNLIRIALNTSPTNANVLGRHGGINILYKVLLHLNKKQQITLRYTLSSLNMMVKNSKTNASKAVGMGIVSLMLNLHKEFHKSDYRSEKVFLIRKTILLVLKNVSSLKSSRVAFAEASGLNVLYTSCKNYLSAANPSRQVTDLLNISAQIVTRCQPKQQLPTPAYICSFAFNLPGKKESDERLSSVSGENYEEDFDTEDSPDDFPDDDEDEDEDIEEDRKLIKIKNKRSKNSLIKSDESDPKTSSKTSSLTRAYEDLKMYERFFLELSDFPWDSTNNIRGSTSTQIGSLKLDSRRGSVVRNKSVPDGLNLEKSSVWKSDCHKDRSHSENPVKVLLEEDETSSSLSRDFVHLLQIGRNHESTSTSSKLSRKSKKSKSDDKSSTSDGESFRNLFLESFEVADSNIPSPQLLKMKRSYRNKITSLATKTISVKGGINRLSLADEHLSEPIYWKSEPLLSTKGNQRLMRSRVISDLSRTVNPHKLIATCVFDSSPSSDDVAKKMTSRSNPDINSSSSFDTKKQNKLKTSEPLLIPTGILDNSSPRPNSKLSSGSMVLPSVDWNSNFSGATLTSSDQTSALESSSLLEQIFVESTEQRSSDEELAEDRLSPPLHFNSDFESGNLRSAFRIREFEYDLVLNSDCNTHNHFQWFYFEVSQMQVAKWYTFNIINCEKKGSNFNEGMQPVMFSAIEARRGRPFWRRVGRNVCYYRNHFVKHGCQKEDRLNRCHFTATFSVMFEHEADICYLAYHYPYTFTKLQMDLNLLLSQVDSSIFVQQQTLCQTLSGNPVPLLTITAMPTKQESIKDSQDELRSRPYIFLTARVHPGESNASWTMLGTLKLLLTPPSQTDDSSSLASIADELRQSFIFKIVPMLNPDGVINGHHRCSLSGEDLNRTWIDPNPLQHPTIFHTKGLLQYLQAIQKDPLVYCDYHGHSRKMNVFLYGCCHRESIIDSDSSFLVGGPDYPVACKTLPRLLHPRAPIFSWKNCSFAVDKAKLGAARVVVWREFGVVRSYTMESTYCGCDQGEFRGKHVNIWNLEQMGSHFCETLLLLKNREDQRQLPVFEEDNIIETNDENLNVDRVQKTSFIDSDDELTPDEDSFSVSECLCDEEDLDCSSLHYPKPMEVQMDSSTTKSQLASKRLPEAVKATHKNKPINKNNNNKNKIVNNSSINNNNKPIDKSIPSSNQNKGPAPLVYINHSPRRFSRYAQSKKQPRLQDLESNINSDDDKYSEMLAITQISLDPRPHSSPHSYSFPRPFESKRSPRSSQGN